MLRGEKRQAEADELLRAAYERQLALEQLDEAPFVGLARLQFAKGDAAGGLKQLKLMLDLALAATHSTAAAELAALPQVKARAVEAAWIEKPAASNQLSPGRIAATGSGNRRRVRAVRRGHRMAAAVAGNCAGRQRLPAGTCALAGRQQAGSQSRGDAGDVDCGSPRQQANTLDCVVDCAGSCRQTRGRLANAVRAGSRRQRPRSHCCCRSAGGV